MSQTRRWLLLTLFAFLIVSPRVLLVELSSMDELWMFQYSRRIMTAQVPYRDFYMLPAPLAATINGLALKWAGDQLVILRLIALFVVLLTGGIAVVLTLRLGIRGGMAVIPAALYFWSVFSFPYNSYTWLCLLFLWCAFLGEVLSLDGFDVRGTRSIPLEFGIGLALGLATLSKQHIGVCAFLLSALFLWINDHRGSRESLFKSMGARCCGYILIVGSCLLVLGLLGALGEFISYSILRSPDVNALLGEYLHLLAGKGLIALIALVMPLGILHSLFWSIRLWDRPEARRLLLSFVYGIANAIIVMPFVDEKHLLMALPMCMVGLVYSAELMLRPNKWPWAEMLSGVSFALVAFLVLISVLTVRQVADGTLRLSRLTHYSYVPIAPAEETVANEVGGFIERAEQSGGHVLFLDYRATAYLIPLDRFARYYDCTFDRDLGPAGREFFMNEMQRDEDAVVLLSPGASPLESKVLVGYVVSNMKKEREVGGFDVYRHH